MLQWDDLGKTYEEGDGKIYQQFTGIFDKKGEPVYEGDILKYKPKRKADKTSGIYVVYFEYVFAGFSCYNIDETSGMFYTPIMFGAMEVIGNIYENPKLLKI